MHYKRHVFPRFLGQSKVHPCFHVQFALSLASSIGLALFCAASPLLYRMGSTDVLLILLTR